jgi:ABC-type glutathione transport system ATPase component
MGDHDVGAELWTWNPQVQQQQQAQQHPQQQQQLQQRRSHDLEGGDDGVRLDVINLSYSLKINNKLKALLKNISFRVYPGELCALMGSSGAGKRYMLKNIVKRVVDQGRL